MTIRLLHFLRGSLILLASLFSGTYNASAAFKDYTEVVNNLNNRLAAHCPPQDSLHVLCNLLDIAQIRPMMYNPDSIMRLTYSVALHNNDTNTAFEMLRHLSNMYNQQIDSLNEFLQYAKALPGGEQRDETITFIEMQRNSYYSFYAEEDKREKRFDEKLKKLVQNPPEDIYEQIYLLHAICLHLYRDANGELMVKYFDELNKLVDQLPADCYSLRNIATVQSALAFSLAGEKDKSIEADKKLLDIIDNLKAYHNAHVRPYRSYLANRYIIYTRLLSNWEALSDGEIEEYYNMAMRLKDTDVRSHNTYNNMPMPSIYYAMAHDDFKKVIELTKDIPFETNSTLRKTEILRFLIQAAEYENDKDLLLRASREYNRQLEKLNRHTDHDRELEVLYDTHNMREQISQNEIERQKDVNRLQHAIIVICGIALIGLIIMLLCLIRLYRHSRKLSETLLISNEALKTESCALRSSQREVSSARDAARKANEFKSDFIKNLGHEVSAPFSAIIEYSHLLVDCSDASKKPYLEQYARMVTHNIEFISTVLNDVFHLSEIDSNTVSIKRKHTSIQMIAELAVNTVSPALNPGVEIEIKSDPADLDTFTDPTRLQQILNNVLENAVRYTTQGKILVDCYKLEGGKMIAIAISDNGPGIDPKHKEHIFERFVKLNNHEEGAGLGLPLSRLIARLLGGDLVLDTTYTRGARFILTIPYAIK